MERGKWDFQPCCEEDDHLEVHNARKRLDPATLFCRSVKSDRRVINVQSLGVTCGGGGRVWKRPLPRLQKIRGIEFDVGEEVFSSARNPPFGDETATPKRVWCIV